MTATVIRPATPADIPAVTCIYAHAVRHGTASFELDPPDETEMAQRLMALVEAGYPYLVAQRDGTIAGYAYAGPYRARPAYRFSVENSVYVAHDALRMGIGRALMERLIAECEARNYRLMIAVIGDSAQTSSIALHRALGFRTVGAFEGVGYKFGRWLDTVLMQRALGKGAGAPP
jgi:L-amino acid N-acyltransferase YncA